MDLLPLFVLQAVTETSLSKLMVMHLVGDDLCGAPVAPDCLVWNCSDHCSWLVELLVVLLVGYVHLHCEVQTADRLVPRVEHVHPLQCPAVLAAVTFHQATTSLVVVCPPNLLVDSSVAL